MKVSPEDAVPSDVLQSHNREVVSKFLHYFALEVRREDGERYNSGTIRGLLCGLNRVLKANRVPFSILDKNEQLLHVTQSAVQQRKRWFSVGSSDHCNLVGPFPKIRPHVLWR